MKKRIISLTTSMAMVSSLFVALPINTYAADSIDGIYAESLTSSAFTIGDTFTIGSLTYEVIADGEVEVFKCDSFATGAIDIPACVSYGENDFNVTSIYTTAFINCTKVTRIYIPNSITKIESGAFPNVTKLEGIYVDDENQNYCSDNGVLFNKDKTELIIAPRTLTEYIIPSSVKQIGNSAFNGCKNLGGVTIGDNVTSIGGSAFYECESLISISIPNSVKTIGGGAFYRCTNLKYVEFGDSVTELGEYAFNYCYALETVTLPDSVTNINRAFNCTGLTSIDLGQGVKSLKYRAFWGNSKLASVTFGSNFISVGSSAFEGCESLINVYYYGTEEQWGKISISDGNFYLTDCATMHYHTHNFNTWTTTKPATCTSTGTSIRKCSACGKTETKVIPKLAHRYTATAVKPTYAAKGYTLHKCSVCGTSYKDNHTAKKTVPTVSVKSSYTYAPDAVRINWNKVSGASGYRIFRYNTATKKWQVVGRIFNNSTFNFRNSGLKPGTAYKYSVQAFVKENGRYFYGKCSPYIYTATKPSSTKITKNTYAPDAVRLYWNKVSCSGYKIQKYNSATKTWTTIKKVPGSATNYRISGLRRNTAYKFRIQPYKAAGAGKYSYGTVSASYTARTSK